MLVWGKRSETEDLGPTGVHNCPVCEQERSFRLLLNYEWSHMYWIFGQVSSKTYHVACEICNRGWEADSQEVEKQLEQNPIPFMRRMGWVFPAAGLVGFIVLIVGAAVA